ncbi:MAG TPA: elongation factor Ts [Chloroflexi bacterium]|nr:elongation factor Ts [Chloroflexota bacterium]
MEAKRALNEAGGDFGKAKKLLEQWGAASAAKRAGRTASQGVIEPYIHGGGQIGALVELDCETDFVARTEDFRNLAHEIAMHVAAMNPRYLSIDEIPEAEAGEVRQRLRDEAISKGKTAEIADRVAEGGFKKYLEQNVLLEQPYVRDDSKKIKQLVQEVATKTGENVLVKRFTRYQIGL